jgi:hypothetical protein
MAQYQTLSVLRRWCPRQRHFVLVLLLLISVVPAAAQQTKCYVPPCVPNTGPAKLNITYGGRIYYSFPRYDVYLSGAPQNVFDRTTGGGNLRSSVIVNNGQGLRWDGFSYFDHPAYHQELVTRYYYANRVIGQPSVPPITMRVTPKVRGVVSPTRTVPQPTATTITYLPAVPLVTVPVPQELPPLRRPVPSPGVTQYGTEIPSQGIPAELPKPVQPSISTAIAPLYRTRCIEQTGITTAIQPLNSSHCVPAPPGR